jgi:outer membrane protein TolC
MAMLLGKAHADFALSPTTAELVPPDIPVGVPSELLERRPDVAASERMLAQADAQIGVAKSAYFPNVTLSATAGFTGLSALDWFTWPSRFWAVGPSITETIFDGGLRKATMQQYRSQYDAVVASYRQTTLTAFQQVEDSLVACCVLRGELDQQNRAVAAAQRAIGAISRGPTSNSLLRAKAAYRSYPTVRTGHGAVMMIRKVRCGGR